MLRSSGSGSPTSGNEKLLHASPTFFAGMSTVHVNRTLQDLRSMRLIELERGKLTVLNWGKLQEIGDFDPAYLHLVDPGRLGEFAA